MLYPNCRHGACVLLRHATRPAARCTAWYCRYYRAYGDTSDANGHGTHVVGTLVGFPYGYTLDQTTDITRYSGMAPDAKVAFIGG